MSEAGSSRHLPGDGPEGGACEGTNTKGWAPPAAHRGRSRAAVDGHARRAGARAGPGGGRRGGDGQVPFTFNNSGRIGTDIIHADARGEIFSIPYSASKSTTATFTDTTLPTVDSVTPTKGLTRQPRSTSPTATFSEQMNPDSLTSSSVKLYRWNGNKKRWMRIRDVQVSCDSPCKTATLDPYPADDAKRLAASTRYRVVISTVARHQRQLAGRELRLEVHHRKELGVAARVTI